MTSMEREVTESIPIPRKPHVYKRDEYRVLQALAEGDLTIYELEVQLNKSPMETVHLLERLIRQGKVVGILERGRLKLHLVPGSLIEWLLENVRA